MCVLRVLKVVSEGSPDTPPSSLMDSIVSLKVNNKRKRSWVRSLARNTLGAEGHTGAPGWD